MKTVGSVGKVGFSKAMSAGWIVIDKTQGKPIVKRKVQDIVDTVKENLNGLANG